MTANSPIVLRIHLKSSDNPKKKEAMNALEISSTKTTSSAFCQSSKAVCCEGSERRKKPSGISKDTRRERNRITARESRDRKAMYIVQLETDVMRLNERVAQLEFELLLVTSSSSSSAGSSDTTTTTSANTTTTTTMYNCNSFSFLDAVDASTTMTSASSLLLLGSPETSMGFFDP